MRRWAPSLIIRDGITHDPIRRSFRLRRCRGARRPRRSAPVQKPSPVAVRTTARTAWSRGGLLEKADDPLALIRGDGVAHLGTVEGDPGDAALDPVHEPALRAAALRRRCVAASFSARVVGHLVGHSVRAARSAAQRVLPRGRRLVNVADIVDARTRQARPRGPAVSGRAPRRERVGDSSADTSCRPVNRKHSSRTAGRRPRGRTGGDRRAASSRTWGRR